MIQSMTGFGLGKASNALYEVTVEVKSLNSKALESSLRLPRSYFAQELVLKALLASRLGRGKVALAVQVQGQQAAAQPALVQLNRTQLLAYYHTLQAIAQEVGSKEPIRVEALVSLPGVIEDPAAELEDPQEWALVQQAVDQALEALIAARKQEGATLMHDFLLRLSLLQELLAQVPPLEQERKAAVQERLQQAVAGVANLPQGHEDRFQQELIYYLEKNDITEEQVRLQTHLELFSTTLQEPESQGRKLGFIAQEMGREINTLGAKAYHAGLQALVVRMKDELEKIKEQLLNIL